MTREFGIKDFSFFQLFISPSTSGKTCCSAIFNDDLLHEIIHENQKQAKFLFPFLNIKNKEVIFAIFRLLLQLKNDHKF
jgi:hypothetical protein